MSEKALTKTENNERELTRAEEKFITPPVDIYETEKGLILTADMPGVKKEDIDIQINDNILTIKGTTKYEPKENPIYQEFNILNYYRQFSISDEIDQTKIKAIMENGILNLEMPKQEEVKPTKVKIKVKW